MSDTLYRLRQALGTDWLSADAERISLRVTSDLWVDVWEFERLLATDEAPQVERAIDLYNGDLLPEIYDDWVLSPRMMLRERYLEACRRVAEDYEAGGDLSTALLYTRRVITTEPLHEESHRQYLRLLGRLNRRAEALAHYEYLRDLLQTELGVDPMPETRAIVDAIRREVALQQATPTSQERTPFVGRRSERAAILEAVEAALAGRGSVIAVEGPAGIGKSRLLREVAGGARWRGMRVATGRVGVAPDDSPFAPLVDALAPFWRGQRAARLETLLSPETQAALAPLNVPWPTSTSLPALPPVQARDRFHRALTTLLSTFANLRPLVLILDDMHRADPAFWDALDAIVPALNDVRCLLLLAYRRPAIEAQPGWPLVQRWERDGRLRVLSLPPLSERDVAALLPADKRDEAFRVSAGTGGNPFYITEWVAEAAAGRRPGTHVTIARIATLSEQARDALECAAVLGDTVPYRLWARVSSLEPLALATASEELTARSFLEPTDAGYRFVHDLIQSTVYEQLESQRRRPLHRRAAATLAVHDPDNLRAQAFHVDRAGDVSDAAELYRRAAERDLARFAFREAQTSLERALELLPTAAVRLRVDVCLSLARVCDITGDRRWQQQAVAEAMRAIDAFDDPELHACVLLAAGDLATKTGRHEDASTHLQRALAIAEEVDDDEGQTEILLQLGDLEIRTGRVRAAKRYFERGLERARQIGHRAFEAEALDGLGFVLPAVGGDPAVAEGAFERAIAIRRSIEDRFGEARTLLNLVSFLQSRGQLDRAMELGEEALALNEALGYRRGVAVARATQGLVAAALGDYTAARESLTAARDDFAAIGDTDGAGLQTNNLGVVTARAGRLDEPVVLLQEALAIAEDNGATLYTAFAQHDLAATYLQQGCAARALPLLEAASETFERNGDALAYHRSRALLGVAHCETGDRERASAIATQELDVFHSGTLDGEDLQYWLWALWQLLSKLERAEDAEAVVRGAYDVLQQQAGAIADREVRRRFFEQVPVNHELTAAYRHVTEQAGTSTVCLARADAPLGRPLTDDEVVTVRWTIAAPEDDTIAGKVDRRRHRLQRLLAEAAAQGAAPTDGDLADALGVSRRTILRDMKALARAGVSLPTRRRSNE